MGAFARRTAMRLKRPTWSACYDCSRACASACKQKGGTLSGGEQQMLAMGRALMAAQAAAAGRADHGSGAGPGRDDLRHDRGASIRPAWLILLVEQNARWRSTWRTAGTCSKRGASCSKIRPAPCRRTSRCKRRIWVSNRRLESELRRQKSEVRRQSQNSDVRGWRGRFERESQPTRPRRLTAAFRILTSGARQRRQQQRDAKDRKVVHPQIRGHQRRLD